MAQTNFQQGVLAKFAMVPVSLSPKPGFCVKSTTLSPAVFYPPRSEQQKTNLLEPAPVGPVVVPQNRKVFVNIAWDTNVPPPPEGSEEAIQNAMQGEEIDEDNPNGWFVPVIVSNAKADKDKGAFTFCLPPPPKKTPFNNQRFQLETLAWYMIACSTPP